jgi:regulator of protease activity HflC (stomatin/prohibitin superfamily)
VAETSYTRARRTALYGLLLQIIAFGGVLVLGQSSLSVAMFTLAWYIGGGIPLWFVCLLVFRQHELVALESLDLEELRREKQSAGGGEAIFDEEGGGALGFRVAETRLRWMQRWLLPAFGLVTALYLAGMGMWLWYQVKTLGVLGRGELQNLPISMILLGVGVLLLFLFARYASGMARVKEWQHLRACGSYMLGNAIAAAAAIICLGVAISPLKTPTPEHVLAYLIPVVMVLVAAETLINFILDVYRPRTPGVEPRACFDSRLLALIAEPGGIASTIAEAMNYQFGFEVSHTWFYQLLQRTFVPLLGAGLVILWALTCMLVVQPGEHAIVERFGRQLNAETPHKCGLHWKLPWPIDVAHKYNTGELHQIIIGFKQFDAAPQADKEQTLDVALWDDVKHMGQPHFDFLIPVPRRVAELTMARPAEPTVAETQPTTAPGERRPEEALPVNMVRMDVAIQYRIREDDLADYTVNIVNAQETLRDLAWEEVVRYSASNDLFTLLGEKYATAAMELRERIRRHVEELDLGLEIVYVGVQNVHPEPGVSKEFRRVVTAEQEKIAAIREAIVKENQVLSAVAGSRGVAINLAQAIDHIGPNTTALNDAQAVLSTADAGLVETYRQRVAEHEAALRAVVEADWRLQLARLDKQQVDYDFDLGLQDVGDKARAGAAVTAAEAALEAAKATLTEELAEVETAARQQLSEPVVAALREEAQAQTGLTFWNGRLQQLLPGVQGEAAVVLAKAQAERWAIEMRAAAEVARVDGERAAYRAAPRVYKIRKYLEVLTAGIKDSRKFFLAFDPGNRWVRVRLMAEEQARTGIEDIETRQPTRP